MNLLLRAPGESTPRENKADATTQKPSSRVKKSAMVECTDKFTGSQWFRGERNVRFGGKVGLFTVVSALIALALFVCLLLGIVLLVIYAVRHRDKDQRNLAQEARA